ncbi:MAG: DNA/RNA non-specific endonuclease [Deltaproteobacteria bacterium]|nr:DNA/RNA non-specific endonuclease [Deltaproteobacteria bacterium]
MPVTLAELVATYHWTPESDAYRLIRAACARRRSDTDARVIVSVARIDRYLANPRDGAFVSSELIRAFERELEDAPVLELAPPRSVGVSTRMPRWRRDADTNADRFVTVEEIAAYYAEGASGAASPSLAAGHCHITDQAIAMIRHDVAELTREREDLEVRSVEAAEELDRDYFASWWDGALRQPHVLSYALTEADLATRTPVDRKEVERFHADPELIACDRATGEHDSVLPAWYATRYSPIVGSNGKPARCDQGHQMPFNDYADYEAARQSFNMINMSGQSWVLNEQPWRLYEDAIHSLVEAIPGAEATIYVGNLFLGPDGLPQTEDGRLDAAGVLIPGTRLTWYGPGRDRRPGDAGYGEDRFAIPTDCVRAALIRLPDGTTTTIALRMRNEWDLPTRAEPDPANPARASIHAFFHTECVTSIDEVEALLGVDLALREGRRARTIEASEDGASVLLPYLRDDLSRDDRAAIRLLFPVGADLPGTLDLERVPESATSAEGR